MKMLSELQEMRKRRSKGRRSHHKPAGVDEFSSAPFHICSICCSVQVLLTNARSTAYPVRE
jgi:hypothetical protein